MRSSIISESPSFTSALLNAGRDIGARAASRAIAPTDAAARKLIDKLDPSAAALWRERESVEAERVMSKLGVCLSAAGAIPFGLLSVTGVAGLLSNPILAPVGAFMLVAGVVGMFICGVAAWRTQRAASTAQKVACKLDAQLHQAVAALDSPLRTPSRRSIVRARSQPPMREAGGPSYKIPGCYPGDLALIDLLD